MPSNSNKKFRAVRSTGRPKQYEVEEEFDQSIEAMGDSELPPQESKNIYPIAANDSSVFVLPMEPPLHAIRRAIRELESGSLDELVINKLISLDRKSAEFREEYVRIRALSLVRPRPSSQSYNENYIIMGGAEAQSLEEQEEISYQNPWSVNSLWDLWRFFGPSLTLVIVLQLVFSLKFVALLRKLDIPVGNFPSGMIALIIASLSLYTSYLVLNGCKGREYNQFSPRIVGIGVVSAVLAVFTVLLIKFL
jgi:hypothetical protein